MASTKKVGNQKPPTVLGSSASTFSSAPNIQQLVSIEDKVPNDKDWYIFVNSYLNLSLYACESILTKKFTTKNKAVLIAIIFNIKHSLEIIIKAFQKTLNEETEVKYGHNIKLLISEFKKNIIKKSKNTPEKKKSLSKDIGKLEDFINKYYELSILNSYLKDCFTISDPENTFLRYPKNSAYLTVNYDKLFNQMTNADLVNIKKDIDMIAVLVKKIKPTLQ